MLLARASKVIDKAAVSRAYHAGVRKAWNIAMKRLTAFCAIAVLLLGEAAAEGRTGNEVTAERGMTKVMIGPGEAQST